MPGQSSHAQLSMTLRQKQMRVQNTAISAMHKKETLSQPLSSDGAKVTGKHQATPATFTAVNRRSPGGYAEPNLTSVSSASDQRASDDHRFATILESLPVSPKARMFVQCTLERHVLKKQDAEFLITHLNQFILREHENSRLSSNIDTEAMRLSNTNGTCNASAGTQQSQLVANSGLAQKVMRIDWPLITNDADDHDLSEELFQQARRALCHIIAYNNRLSNFSLFHTVSMFRRFKSVAMPAAATEQPSADCPSYEVNFDDEYFARVHSLLDACCSAVPLNADSVTVCLSRTHPYRSKPAAEHYNYIRNLLTFIERHPRYRLDVLTSIIQELNDIDHMLPSVLLTTAEKPDKTATELSKSSLLMTHPLAETMNITMHLLLQYVSKIFAASVDAARQLFCECFQPIFEAGLIRSHYIRHTQYVWFYMASQDADIRDKFITQLWEKFNTPSVPTVLRQSAIHYLCSFLARSNCVNDELALVWLVRILKWCDVYVELAGKRSSMALPEWTAENWANGGGSGSNVSDQDENLARHGVFYAAVHMSLYLLCFRSVELFAHGGKARAYITERAPLRRIVYSSLNPLRFCSSAVVEFFTEVCRHYRVMLLHPLVEENMRNAVTASRKAIQLPMVEQNLAMQNAEMGSGHHDGEVEEQQGGGKADEDGTLPDKQQKLSAAEWRLIHRVYPLMNFFAFEPYRLKRDCDMIAPYYKMFHGLVGEDSVKDCDSTTENETVPVNLCATSSSTNNAAKVVKGRSKKPANAVAVVEQQPEPMKRQRLNLSAEQLMAFAERRSFKKPKLR